MRCFSLGIISTLGSRCSCLKDTAQYFKPMVLSSFICTYKIHFMLRGSYLLLVVFILERKLSPKKLMTGHIKKDETKNQPKETCP